MAVDKLVDSTQLDTDLTSVANAIRTKGGTSAQLAFPSGFVSAIGDIPTGGTLITKTITENGTYSAEDDNADGYSEVTVDVPSGGGGYTLEQLTSDCFLNVNLVLPSDITSISEYAFYHKGLSSVTGANVTNIGDRAFADRRNNIGFIFNFPNLERTDPYIFGNQTFNNEPVTVTAYFCGTSTFEGSTNLPQVKYTRATTINADQVYNVGSVTTIIINSTPTSISNNAFRRANALTDIYVPWSEGAVNGAPWGATSATIHYNTTFDANGDPT